jgi:hypothetical protein
LRRLRPDRLGREKGRQPSEPASRRRRGLRCVGDRLRAVAREHRRRAGDPRDLTDQDADLLDRIAQLIARPLQQIERFRSPAIGAFGAALAQLSAHLPHPLDALIEIGEHPFEGGGPQQVLGLAFGFGARGEQGLLVRHAVA